MNALRTFWRWIGNKAGRLMTASGGLMSLADLDISPVKPQLEDIFSHKGVQIITLLLFVASFVRHHQVAARHPANPESPAPAASEGGKA